MISIGGREAPPSALLRHHALPLARAAGGQAKFQLAQLIG